MRYCEEYNRVEIVCHSENRGISAARNSGIERCSSEYIAFLDGDDFWMKTKLEKQIAILKENPVVGILFSNFITLHGKKRSPINVNTYSGVSLEYERFFLMDGPIIPSSAIVKRECFERCGCFDEHFKSGEDTEMWLRIASCYPILSMREYLVYKRERSGSLGADLDKRAYYTRQIIELAIKRNSELRHLKDKKLSLLYYNTGFTLINIRKEKDFCEENVSSQFET